MPQFGLSFKISRVAKVLKTFKIFVICSHVGTAFSSKVENMENKYDTSKRPQTDIYKYTEIYGKI